MKFIVLMLCALSFSLRADSIQDFIVKYDYLMNGNLQQKLIDFFGDIKDSDELSLETLIDRFRVAEKSKRLTSKDILSILKIYDENQRSELGKKKLMKLGSVILILPKRPVFL